MNAWKKRARFSVAGSLDRALLTHRLFDAQNTSRELDISNLLPQIAILLREGY